MSGFEVVGVLLGALPLVISGLEHYQEGLESIKSMRRYREIISDFILTFETGAARYTIVCESLLGELMLPDKEYAELLDNPGGIGWQSSLLVAHVQDRLGVSYGLFIRLARRLRKALIKFATRLDLDPDNELKPPWMKKNGAVEVGLQEKFFDKSHRIWQSINVGLGNGSLTKALKMIEDDLFRLERLLEAGARPSTTGQYFKRRKRTSSWQKIRESAKRLFNAIADHWQCSCQHAHEASLRLEARRAPEQASLGVRFSVLFSFDTDTMLTPKPPWEWRSVEIESIAADDVVTTRSTPVTQPVKKGLTISFITSATPPSQNVKTPVPKSPKIKDLCNALQSRTSEIDCLGFLDDQIWHHHIFPTARDKSPASNSQRMTIRDCLCRGDPACTLPTTAGSSLGPREKYRLSSILASSVLQLADTPWLSSNWGLQDIYLLNSGPQNSCPERAQPHIRRTFVRPATLVNTSNATARPLVANEIVFALGLILLELSFGQPLSSFKTASDVDAQGNDTPYTDHMIASRLLQTLVLREGEKYADAAKRCLMGSFNSAGSTLEDPAFQEQFYAGVVAPLQEIHDVLR